MQGIHVLALQSMSRRDPKFQKTLEAGLSHVKSVVDGNLSLAKRARSVVFARISSSQLESEHQKALRTLESVSGARVTKTKHLSTFIDHCPPIVEELAASVTKLGDVADFVCHVSFAMSATNTGRRSLEPLTALNLGRLCA